MISRYQYLFTMFLVTTSLSAMDPSPQGASTHHHASTMSRSQNATPSPREIAPECRCEEEILETLVSQITTAACSNDSSLAATAIESLQAFITKIDSYLAVGIFASLLMYAPLIKVCYELAYGDSSRGDALVRMLRMEDLADMHDAATPKPKRFREKPRSLAIPYKPDNHTQVNRGRSSFGSIRKTGRAGRK